MQREHYLEAIRRRVCSVCIDGIFDGKGQFMHCGLPRGRHCPIESYLPDVIEIVETMESPKIEDYLAVLHERVCPRCEQTSDGICEFRLRADCALDRYFMLVAGAIEEVRTAQLN